MTVTFPPFAVYATRLAVALFAGWLFTAWLPYTPETRSWIMAGFVGFVAVATFPDLVGRLRDRTSDRIAFRTVFGSNEFWGIAGSSTAMLVTLAFSRFPFEQALISALAGALFAVAQVGRRAHWSGATSIFRRPVRDGREPTGP